MDHQINTSFPALVRGVPVYVEAHAKIDESGIYSTGIDAVYVDGADVTGLLTDADVAMLDSMIESAIANDASESQLLADYGLGPSAA